MMLKTRVKKLELTRPLAGEDLVARWERVALASLSREEQILVSEADRLTSASQQAYVGVMQRYEAALAATITDVTDEELDRIIKSMGGAGDRKAKAGPGPIQRGV